MERTPSRTGLDFFIRRQESQLLGLQLRMVHAQTDLFPEPLRDDLPLGSWGGFTEWVSDGTPAISIGWDWLMAGDGSIRLVPDSIRTNLMLVDRQGRDLGMVASAAATARLLGRMPWQLSVLAALSGSPSG